MSNCNPAGPSESIVGCSGGDQGCRSWPNVVSYPEATVFGSISCSNPGLNGWCIGSAILNISSNEPVAGYNILDVEGNRNGETFACPGSSCSVPLLEGDSSFNFWALSSWGDSSGMGSASGGVDTQPPLVTGQLSGVTSDGGWFVSTVSATASASDATSGIGSVVYSLDGGPQTAYSGAVTLGDGSHTIVFYAMDRAGNSSSVSLSANVDTTPPAIAVDTPNGTLGAGGWYISDPTQSASAADGGSGLASMEYSLDGGAQTAYIGAISLGDGTHAIVFTATDQAGNVATASQTVNVDTIAPHLTLNAGSVFCPACMQKLAIEYSASDGDSGIAEWAFLVDGVSLKNGFSAESGTFEWDGSSLAPGAHTITLQGRDLAGNTNQIYMTVTLAVPTPTPNGFKIPKPQPPVIIRPANSTETPTATSTAQPGGGGQSTSTRTVSNTPCTGGACSAPTKTNSIIVAMGNPVQGTNGGASISNPATTTPISTSILWGAGAAAAISASMAVVLEQKRKREEEEAQAAMASARFNAAQIALEEQRRLEAAERAWNIKQQEDAKAAEAAANAAFQAKLSEAMGAGLSPMHVNDYIEMAKTSGYAAAIAALDAFIVQAKQDALNAKAFQEYMKQKEAQEAAEKARKEAEEKARKEAEAAVAAQAAAVAAAAEAEKKKPWWEKAIDGVKDAAEKVIKFIDEHQVEIAIGVGLVIGAAAILLTAGTATPFIVAAVAAALTAGVVVGGGTALLNSYYGRPLDQNLLRNFGVAVGSSLVGSISAVLLQGVLALGGQVLTNLGLTTGAVAEGASVGVKACDAWDCQDNIVDPLLDQVVNPALDAAGKLLNPDVLTLYDGMENGGSLPGVPVLDNVAAIGSYLPDGDPGSYDAIAREMGAHYLNIPTAVWDTMTEAERQAANDAWLDYGVKHNWSYYLTTDWNFIEQPVNDDDPGTYLWRELKYLFDHHYTVSLDGKWIIPPP
jgi:hypothetical protein